MPGKADYEIGAAASELTEAAALASRATGEMLPSGHAGRFSLSERIPLGLVGVITPWNFPLVLGMRVIAPALALGNAVLVKPSPETPYSGGLAIAELFAAAGAPAGILQVLPGDSEAGERLVSHPDVAMIHFTGSTTVGRRIAAARGRPAQEGVPGTGRQQRAAGPGRRRPRAGHHDRRLVGLPLPGPDVHHRRAPHRAPRRGRRLPQRAGRPGRGHHGRQHGHRGGRARPDDQRAGSCDRAPADARARRSRPGPGSWPGGTYGRPLLPAHRGGGREPVQPLWTEEIFAPIAPVRGGRRRRQRPCRSPTTPPTAWSTRC